MEMLEAEDQDDRDKEAASRLYVDYRTVLLSGTLTRIVFQG